MRPSKRNIFLKQNFLVCSVAAQPSLERMKAQLQDIETGLKRLDGGDEKMKIG